MFVLSALFHAKPGKEKSVCEGDWDRSREPHVGSRSQGLSSSRPLEKRDPGNKVRIRPGESIEPFGNRTQSNSSSSILGRFEPENVKMLSYVVWHLNKSTRT